MSITVYIDVLFLINLIVNFLIISSVAFILNKKNNTLKFLIASTIGAIYSTIIFFPQLKILSIVVFKLLISLIIVFVAFKHNNLTAYIKSFFTYYLINFLYGGGMYAFYRFTSLGSKMNYSNGEYYIDISLGTIIILTVVFYFLTKIFSNILSEKNQMSFIKEIEITANNKSTFVNALIDTGNSLYDPISQQPVMLVEKEVIEKVLSLNTLNDYGYLKEQKMRIIPFYDANGNSNIIYAFKPQKIYNISDNNEITNTLIGISEHRLCSDQSYQALMHYKHLIKE